MRPLRENHILRWAIVWNSRSTSGPERYFIWNDICPRLFRTRRDAREFISEHYNYIKTRRDLRIKPHCWRLPKPVRVEVTITEKP